MAVVISANNVLGVNDVTTWFWTVINALKTSAGWTQLGSGDAATYAGKSVARVDDKVRLKLYAEKDGDNIVAIYGQNAAGSWVAIDEVVVGDPAPSGTWVYGAVHEGAAKVKA